MDTFAEVIQFVRSAGDRVHAKAGTLTDIGVAKQYVTEEDLRIEREFNELLFRLSDKGELFAEEEHQTFPMGAERVWALDPVSGTKTLIEGLPHYAVVVALLVEGITEFSVIYDPSVQELFTAYKGSGAFLNGQKIHTRPVEDTPSIIVNISSIWNDSAAVKQACDQLAIHTLVQNKNSFAVNYCQIACGRHDGVVAFTKDVFPELAGSLLLKEAGALFTNQFGIEHFATDDRVFCGGIPSIHRMLLKSITNVI
jgi:myo-inositol-1(or 4)-monophosphatase